MNPPDQTPDSKALRALPSVDRVIEALDERTPHATRAEAARSAIETARKRVSEGVQVTIEEIVGDAGSRLAEILAPSLVAVVNATGVLIHTNLGRAPLGDKQLESVREVASGYSDLEYDLARGERGSRYAHAARTLTRITGAEAGLVVNNNAAAVLLVLSSLCAGREVVLSRGEMIEIGGEFRIPEVMSASNAQLKEIGTTNRTHLVDYEKAIGPNTAALLKVHASNFRVVGFTASVQRRDLAKLAHQNELLFIEDLGSGLVTLDDAIAWTRTEPPVRSSIEDGADIVTFSGDKLLGGPQAGVIVGRSDLIERIKRNPMLRALRVDKMTLAALQVTLDAYLDEGWRELPLWRMALASSDEIEARVGKLMNELADLVEAGLKLEALPVESVPGGGSLPGQTIPSWALAIEHPEIGATEIHARLRSASPPVVGRIDESRLLLDLRTVAPADDMIVSRAVRAALS